MRPIIALLVILLTVFAIADSVAQVSKGVKEINFAVSYDRTKTRTVSGSITTLRARLLYNYFFSNGGAVGFAGTYNYLDVGGQPENTFSFGDFAVNLSYHFFTKELVVPYAGIQLGYGLNDQRDDAALYGAYIGFKSFVGDGAAAITLQPFYQGEFSELKAYNFGVWSGVSIFM